MGSKTVEHEAAREPEWLALMDRLQQAMPGIVDDFVAAFAARSLYDRDAVPERDLRETADATLRMLVARMAGREPTAEEAALATTLGVRRARQGVALDALAEAVRLDFRVLWRWLQRLAGDEQRAALVDRVEWVLTVVEHYVDEVQQSFLRESAAMQRDARLATERHLARLLSGDAPSPSTIDGIAQGLGVAADAEFDLVAVPVDRIELAQRAAAAALAAGTVFGHSHGDAYCLFWVRDGALPEALAQLPGVHLQRLEGLLGVAEGARSALALLGTARLGAASAGAEGLTGVERLWPAVAAARLRELVPGFLERRLAALDDLTDYQREAIVATVRAHLETGSVHATARRVYCHRNTVLNRLGAFRERTGLDVQVPIDGALALVLLAAA